MVPGAVASSSNYLRRFARHLNDFDNGQLPKDGPDNKLAVLLLGASEHESNDLSRTERKRSASGIQIRLLAVRIVPLLVLRCAENLRFTSFIRTETQSEIEQITRILHALLFVLRELAEEVVHAIPHHSEKPARDIFDVLVFHNEGLKQSVVSLLNEMFGTLCPVELLPC